MFSVSRIPVVLLALQVTLLSGAYGGEGRVFDSDKVLDSLVEGSGGLGKVSAAARAQAIEALAATVKSGDALMLPRKYDLGDVDLSILPNDVEVSFGRNGRIYLGGRHENMMFLHNEVDLEVGPARGALAKTGAGVSDYGLLNSFAFNTGGIKGGPFKNSYWVIASGFGDGAFQIKGFENSAIVYMAYNQNPKNNFQSVNISGNCAGSRIYHMVETNYCNSKISVILDNVTGPLAMMLGDTEGAAAPSYAFNDSKNILWGIHRIFHSHSFAHGCGGGSPSVVVSGGSGNQFLMSQDIGDPSTEPFTKGGGENGFSLKSDESDLQIWGGSWEDKVDLGSSENVLKVFHTPNVFGGAPVNGWKEPAQVQDEVILTYKGKDLTKGAQGVELPPPPIIPATAVPADGFRKMGRFKQSATFGAALLQAGADPTGLRPSDAAFAKVLADSKLLEIPRGTFLLTRPMVIDDHMVMGAGGEQSVLRTNRKDISVISLSRTGALAKAMVAGPVKPENRGGLTGLTIEGGKWGVDLTNVYYAGKLFSDLIIRDQTEAGIMSGDGKVGAVCGEGGKCEAHEFDQNRFINIKFENTGDYGWYNNMGMNDKLLFLHCSFKGQKKGGIVNNFTSMFNASIIQCRFENIDGPGVDLFPINPPHGYTPHCTMIESCEFIECGSETRPAVDYNWSESNAVANTKIVIKTKKWKYGYLGTGQAMSNVTIDVDLSKMVAGGAALGLRHTRQVRNARPTGNILRDVTATGPIVFLNEAPEIISMDKYFPGTYEGYEWAYPHLLYNCKFSNGEYPYVLVNTDKTGKVVKQVAFEGAAPDPVNPGTALNALNDLNLKANQTWDIYDLQGRMIGKVKGRNESLPDSRDLPRGLFLGKQPGSKSPKLLNRI